ncbi:MAG: long-chain acyl-CoA synthetase [Gammaproteobacteria bacterium]|jgi:fatty-acyl-CoA synthase|nr:long-chain acyl-CoA synthetase [Gammaproteobacteria bacterium]
MSAAATSNTLTESYYPADRSAPLLNITLHDLLRQVAGEVPERVALVEGISDPAARRRWTYAELLRDAQRVGRALLSKFKTGDRIVLYASNSPEWVLLQYGLSFAGLILVPVNPAYTARELEYVVKNSRATGLIYDESYRGRDLREVIAELRERALPDLRETISMTDFDSFSASGDGTCQLPVIDPLQTLQIQYTSGTTGNPKGALLHHRGVINTARNIALRMQFPDGGIHINAMPMFHIAGAAVAEMGVLALRGTFVLMDHFDAGLMLELFESERGNATLIVPTMILGLLDHPDRARRDVSSMQTILTGAANVPAALVRRTQETFNCDLCIIFGQTESNGPITLTAPGDCVADQTETVGKPLTHVEVKIVDPEDGRTLPLDTVGEIWVKGYQTMSGYFDLAAESRHTVRADGWLRTGDLGTMDQRGYVKITGRLKEMIIRGGMHLYPKEMEDVLFDHPEVSQISVLGVPDDKWGEVVAAVILARDPANPPSADELFSYCSRRLASQKVPELWCFVSEYPLTPSGKIQKPVLKRWIVEKRLLPAVWQRPAPRAVSK